MRKILEIIKPYRELILGILLVGLFVSTVYAFQFEEGEEPNSSDQNSQLNPRTSSTTLKSTAKKELTTGKVKSSSKNSPSANSKKSQVKEIYPSSINKKGEERKEEIHYQVKLVVGDGPQTGSYQVEFLPGQNGLAIMEQARSDYGLQFTYQTYSFGVFIDSIGGLASDNHHYWSLYYNGQFSSVGISDLYLNHNDSMGWKYVSF